jgi:hypothetical protein
LQGHAIVTGQGVGTAGHWLRHYDCDFEPCMLLGWPKSMRHQSDSASAEYSLATG